MVWSEDACRPQFVFAPSSLLGAMVCQFAVALHGAWPFKECAYCHRFFRLAPGVNRASSTCTIAVLSAPGSCMTKAGRSGGSSRSYGSSRKATSRASPSYNPGSAGSNSVSLRCDGMWRIEVDMCTI
jgi:hypothetical protein